jgi:hypothetical protein
MKKFIVESVYHVHIIKKGHEFTTTEHLIADSFEDAVAMCREMYPDGHLERVELAFQAKKRPTKTITVEI